MSLIEPENVLSVKSRDDFRRWLADYHATEKECWLHVKRGRPVDDGTFWYLDAVEEALCFGWIDSTIKMLNGTAFQRFSPRRKGSPWTELNKERCRRLERLGKMTDAGRAVLPDMSPEGFSHRPRGACCFAGRRCCMAEFSAFPAALLPCAYRHDTNQ